MKIGEVCLLTRDVPRLAKFYRELLGVPSDGDEDNWGHQFVLSEETSLTVMRDDRPRKGQSAALAFTVRDIDAAYHKVQAMGAKIIEPPTVQPWGAVNMSFRDPDGNAVFFRAFLAEEPHPDS